MSYLALYRKFRPDSFDEVKGQEHVVTTLKNQIAHNRVGHAYLLCGTRGTGKTTIAKLIAKTMNCENPTENGPCGECESCKAIADGSSLNVVEIDAATHNGVDNIRQINEAVQYAPAQGKYLVYIIDEAHQLSKGAYNALLKTLEEPPEYVMFILATTDDSSLPVTLRSRCQRFDFHRISVETIADRMEEILAREGESATRDALMYIARLADGSMRDALSILDECLSVNIGKELNRESVLKIVGAVAVDVYIRMFRAIVNKNAEEALDIINETIWDGKDLTKFSDDLAWFVRNMLFLKISPGIKDELDMTSENADELLAMAENYSVEELAGYLNSLQLLCSEIRKSSVKRITLEMTIIKMMYPSAVTVPTSGNVDVSTAPLQDSDKAAGESPRFETASSGANDNRPAGLTDREVEALVDAKVDRELERRIGEALRTIKLLDQDFASVGTAQQYDDSQQSDIVVENIKNDFPEAVQSDIMQLAKDWKDIVAKLNPIHRRYARAVDVEPSNDYEANGPARLNVILYDANNGKITNTFFENEKNREFLAEAISEIIKKKVELGIIVRKGVRTDLDKTSRAINRIKFNVTVMESEEERNG